jgi:hypothetical protein
VPRDEDQNVYRVMDDFGKLGRFGAKPTPRLIWRRAQLEIRSAWFL